MAKQNEYKNLGEGYSLKYNQKTNYRGGNYKVGMELLKNGTLIKKITDESGWFIDFPGVVDGSWRKKLIGGYDPCVNYVSNMYEFKHGFSLFEWMLQPDGRYDEDETGFGAGSEEEVVLYAYINQKGEFVTPFADFRSKPKLESFEEFKERTNEFIWNSMPNGHDLWVSNSVRSKVDRYGHYKSFFGSTVIFPLEKKDCEKLDGLQQKLEEIRKDFAHIPLEAYLADALNMDTYHLTLHDLFAGTDEGEVLQRIKASEKSVRYIMDQLRKMDVPKIRIVPTAMYNMNSTSVVLGFEAATKEDHDNLMMLYELMQPVVRLKEYTPHVTIRYFRYGKHKEAKIYPLKDLIKSVNESIKQMKEAGRDLTIELDVKNLRYQYFLNMNSYFEGGK